MEVDVKRAFTRYFDKMDESREGLAIIREDLLEMIRMFFILNPSLCYYQVRFCHFPI